MCKKLSWTFILYKNSFKIDQRPKEDSQKKTFVKKRYDIRFGSDFLDITPKAQTMKEKQPGFHKNLKTSCIKRHNQESEKAALTMGENTCKFYI